ncbi:MAG: hypothetical protein QOG00_3608 [Pyrinomonadaceae bacterium]|jgi:uncharacterized membrane protein|nr:hypothetical protein [Pyrinomonadaceae bacterium]MDQ1613677.1 hypothetical protein [Pyrinomonadaceae bacterium]
MSEKRSKYDTDPLDPEFVRETEQLGSAARETARTPNEQSRLNPDADAPTRRIDDVLSQPYPSVFVPPTQTPTPPPAYQQPTYQQPTYQQPTYQQPTYQQTAPTNLGRTAPMVGAPHGQQIAPPTSRPVAGVGIPENLAVVLPYVPFYIGMVGALIELLIVPRTETRVRFHAAQGLALQLAMLVISFMLSFVGRLAGSGFGGGIFWLASFIFLIVSIVRVWKGEPHHLAPLDDATTWLYEHVQLKK